jgi:hypothetical protein
MEQKWHRKLALNNTLYPVIPAGVYAKQAINLIIIYFIETFFSLCTEGVPKLTGNGTFQAFY